MVGGAGYGQSWYEQVTREDAQRKTNKRKRIDADQPAQGCPFSLGSGPDRKEAVSAIYEHVADREPPQKNIASLAIHTFYPNFTVALDKSPCSSLYSK